MNYIIILSFLLINTSLLIFTSFYDLLMAQQESYNSYNHYFKFINKDIKNNYTVFLLKLLIACYTLLYKDINLLLLIVYIIITVVLLLNSIVVFNKHNKKLPLKFTKRVIRIASVDYLLYILLMICLRNHLIILLSLSIFYILFNPYILISVLYILKPVEKKIFNKYKTTALEKLNRMNNINIIGITGSYGKTSTKMVLESILSKQYNGFYTPNSFNTPNGIVMTINNQSTIFNDYFICEMGAKSTGEIKELCNIVHPKYGILTSIGPAHLESFKCIENIINTKFELIENLPNDGVAILNKDDVYMKNYHIKNNCKIIWIGLNDTADIYASNIKVDENGTNFLIHFKKEKEFKVHTALLGNKNIYNILASVALAKELNIKNDDIKNAINELKPIKHRLEIKKVNNITIIDDAFNSNPEGSKMALEVLSLMKGKKYIITPGMVELGEKQNFYNRDFGKQIANACDEVYLIGKKQTKPIYEGLLISKFNENSIHIFNSFNEAYDNIIKTNGNINISLLIENDLPDSYMEE